MNKYKLQGFIRNRKTYEHRDNLMLVAKIFRACIDTKIMPKRGSKFHNKVIELTGKSRTRYRMLKK